MTSPKTTAEDSQGATRLVFLCRVDDLSDGEVRAVAAGGPPAIAVYRIGGRYYATDDDCTHASAALSDGDLKGDIIECPLHGGAFHVPSGHPTELPCEVPLRTYAIRIVDDQVFAVVES